MAGLLGAAVVLAGRTAPSRAVFGPHETNLGDGRALSARHVAYYARRAAGGAGLIVTETASVHASDWPYERAPLAADCGPGWAAVAKACRPHGSLVLAGLGHDGLQGSSAYSRSVLWAPSPFADPGSRELPMAMEIEDIDALVVGFAAAARAAVAAGLDGVEIDAGPTALLRQFQSGLTNERTDEYGRDRLLLTRRVLDAVRAELGPDRILGLRLSGDELAPWAGITPEQAIEQVTALAGFLDLLVVTRGGPYSGSAYRPDAHTPPAFNRELSAALRAAAGGRCRVALQGSVVDVADAEAALGDGTADLVEMTRALIADADLVVKVRTGRAVRPCVLCNQTCRVRDHRNPIVSCIVDPRSGYETVDADPLGPAVDPGRVLVVGAGVAGLETARVLAERGHAVRLTERRAVTGGALRLAAVGPGRERLALFVDWLHAEVARLGVRVETGREVGAAEPVDGEAVVLATGARPRPSPMRSVAQVLDDGLDALPAGPLVLDDPVGGPVAVAVAEWLARAGRVVSLVTPDEVAGSQLSDVAEVNARLQRAGVTRELRARIREHRPESVLLEDRWTGARREIAAALVIDCGPGVASAPDGPGIRVGDCLAPRSVYEAVLDARRAALELGRPAAVLAS